MSHILKQIEKLRSEYSTWFVVKHLSNVLPHDVGKAEPWLNEFLLEKAKKIGLLREGESNVNDSWWPIKYHNFLVKNFQYDYWTLRENPTNAEHALKQDSLLKDTGDPVLSSTELSSYLLVLFGKPKNKNKQNTKLSCR